jgi:hypothetical protein
MQAQTLKEAIRLLDPYRPLQTPEEFRKYYVARSHNPIDTIALMLQNTTEPQKFLLTGAPGSGVTTEFFRLIDQLQKNYFIVHYSIKERFTLTDLTVADVLLSLGLEIFRQAFRQNISISPTSINQSLKFLTGIVRAEELQTFFETALWALKEGGSETKKPQAVQRTSLETRLFAASRVYDLIETINHLVFEIEASTKRRIVVLIEDIDKTPTELVTKLFQDFSDLLLSPQISIIYSFPFSLCHGNTFGRIRLAFSNFYLFPNFQFNQNREINNVLLKRTSKSLFEEALLGNLWHDVAREELVQLSGGLPRQLLILARQSCLEAMRKKKSKVQLGDIDQAARDYRLGFQSMLTIRQLELLKNISQARRIEKDQDHQFLLESLAVLAYENENGLFYDVNPILKPLIV